MNRIRAARQARGWTQADLTTRSRVSRTHDPRHREGAAVQAGDEAEDPRCARGALGVARGVLPASASGACRASRLGRPGRFQERLITAAAPLLAAALLLAVAAAHADPATPAEPGTLVHEGVERRYLLHRPSQRETGTLAPLVLVLHGGGGTPEQMDRGTNHAMSAEASRRGFLLVFPEGMERAWNDGRTEHLRKPLGRKEAHDDVGFLSALIDRMVAEHGADPERVYATGISNGGFMSVRLAMELSGKVAAVAP